MRVHAGAVVLEEGLGHEGDGVAALRRGVLDDVLELHDLVGHLKQRVEADVDLRLAGDADFMVMHFRLDAGLDEVSTISVRRSCRVSIGGTGK